jgi:hypothetical protein
MYITLRKCMIDDFEIGKDSTVDEISFICRLKLFTIGASHRVRENWLMTI